METGDHLARCLVYVDLNMVLAEVVRHPRDWEVSGYREIQSPPLRYCVIDRVALAEVLGLSQPGALSCLHQGWVEAALQSPAGREEIWTRSLAVGSETFVRRVQQEVSYCGAARDLGVSEKQASITKAIDYEKMRGEFA